MKLNPLFLTSLFVLLLNIIWYDQIRIRRRLKKRILKRPLFAVYLLLTPVMVMLSANLIAHSALFLVAFALLGLSFSFSHFRFAMSYPGALGSIVPLSALHILAGSGLLAFTLVQLI